MEKIKTGFETKRNPQVTILMAVHNAEAFLDKSLESLTAQTFREFQAICVDDASTDSSWEILQNYARRDPRIEVVHLSENHGQGHARNVALHMAKGNFIGFLDSDDYLSDDALEKAMEVFCSDSQVDSVLLRVCYTDENGIPTSFYPMEFFQEMGGEEALEASLTWRIHGVYLVRSSVHQKYPYDETSHAYSDDNTTRLHYLHSRKVSCCEGIYYYRQHQQSVTHLVSMAQFDYLSANLSMKQHLLQSNVTDRLLSLYENERWVNCVGLYLFLYRHRKEFSPDECHEAFLKIKAAWQTIEPKRLAFKNRFKFGYIPFKWSWQLFRLQEEVYCRLRVLKDTAMHKLSTRGKAKTAIG